MKKLVFLKNDTPLTTSLVIAEGTENEHRSIIRLIQTYETQFKRWGKVRFMDLKSTNPEGGRPTKVAPHRSKKFRYRACAQARKRAWMKERFK